MYPNINIGQTEYYSLLIQTKKSLDVTNCNPGYLAKCS